MAQPEVHLLVTGGLAALYWKRWGMQEVKWRKLFTLAVIIFFGFLIDIDHFMAMPWPKGMITEGYSGRGVELWRSVIIFEPVYWLHSAYAGIAAALLCKLCRSYLPFVAFVGHIALDIIYTPAIQNIDKPIIRDFYLLMIWLTGP